jgi:hypothetical protein
MRKLVMLEAGDTLLLQKGWYLRVNKPGSEYQIFNPEAGDPLAEGHPRDYYTVDNGPYSPVITEEPDHARALGVGNYLNAAGAPTNVAAKLKGVICKATPGTGGDLIYRGNLSNFLKKDRGSFENDNAAVILVKDRRWILYRLVAENKNRIVGYIGFYRPAANNEEQPGDIQVLEVQDLG